ncbi:MAG: MBL fold metallo-hydrolase [Deltaproteobacteria bacterium]|nr:MBL fold metallo-hydrolase [Deltaproteobacteria bacterium]
MIIRCWGARGSIPVSGPEYIKYGGDTTCVEIRTKNDEIIIIDAGSSIRRVGNRLIKEGRLEFTMIFTHAHWDHVMGFPFFKPIYVSKSRINVCGCPFAQSTVEEMIAKVMSPPYFPVNYNDIHADITYGGNCVDSFTIDSVEVVPIPLSHPNQGLGYKFIEDGKSFVFLTDNELTLRHEGGLDYPDYLEFSSGADLLIHDAEYTEEDYAKTKGWGHSIFTDALRLAMEGNVRQLGLFHHNQDRSDDGIDQMVEQCRGIIRRSNTSMDCFAVHQNMEILL